MGLQKGARLTAKRKYLPVVASAAEETRLCSQECGAKCCRSPGNTYITDDEMRTLKRRAKELGLDFKVLGAPKQDNPMVEKMRVQMHKNWVLDMRLSDGRTKAKREDPAACVFLDLSTNLCRVYEDRPSGCRAFPGEPNYGCLLWPHDDPNNDARVEVY